MAHHKESHTLPLTAREKTYLEDVSSSRTGSVLRARRAAMLLNYNNGVPISEIARIFRCSPRKAEQWIDKAILQEVLAARQKDGKGRDFRRITAAMMDWVYGLSCQHPGNFGYTCAEWPPSLLAQHVRDHCRAAGHHALANVSCAELERLMARHQDRARHARRAAVKSMAG